MDPPPGIELMEEFEAKSVSVGEKRPIANGGDGELMAPLKKKKKKKARCGSGEMKRVAEIVLVLSAMAEMRGGRSPTAAEAEMMAEARAKVAAMCELLAPKDVVETEAIGAVIEDLGLNFKAKEQKLGFRPPKMSIAEKILLTKRRMEESKEFAAHSGTYSSQRLQTGLGAAAESRGTSHTNRVLPSDKPINAPISSGGFPTTSSPGSSTSLPYQYPTKEVRPSMVSSGLPGSHLVRDSSSLALPRVERANFRLDAGARQVQDSSVNHALVNAPTWSLQPQSASAAKAGPENKVQNHTSIKVDGTASRVAPQATRDQTSRPIITQTASGNLPSTLPPLQGMNFVPAPQLPNNHNEIGKIVHKLLQPRLPGHPTWTPPSRDYMNKALTCQICQLTINEVENVLLCDACEKGFHLKCLQAYNQKGIPRGEWHCPKCLTLSNGKPLPPKYGRVMRNMNTPKVPPKISAAQSTSEKKVGTLDQKENQQQITANGSSSVQSPPQTGTTGGDCVESGSVSDISNSREMQGNNFSSSINMDDKIISGTIQDNSMKSMGADSGSPVDSASGKSVQVQNSESSLCEEGPLSVSKSISPDKLADTVTNVSDHAQASNTSQDALRTGGPKCAEMPSKKHLDHNTMVKVSDMRETLDNNLRCDIKQDNQDVEQAVPDGTSGVSAGSRERVGFPTDSLHSVDWIGDALNVVDEKTFYNAACINGVSYKVQDHALFRSSNDKLVPSKLQAMWEDSKTGSKWVIVNCCYFPDDLPEVVVRPCTPESNEVYESNHDSTVMGGLIQGPCEVLPPEKYKEESQRTRLGSGASDGMRPVFLCKWLYDEFKGLFQPVSS